MIKQFFEDFNEIFNAEIAFFAKMFNIISESNREFDDLVYKSIKKYGEEHNGQYFYTIKVPTHELKIKNMSTNNSDVDKDLIGNNDRLDWIIHIAGVCLVIGLIVILIIYLYMYLYNNRYNIIYIYIKILQYLVFILKYTISILKNIKINYITKLVNILHKKNVLQLIYWYNHMLIFFFKIIQKMEDYIRKTENFYCKNINEKSLNIINNRINMKKHIKNRKIKNKNKIFLSSFYLNILIKKNSISDRYLLFIDRFIKFIKYTSFLMYICFYMIAIITLTIGVIILIGVYFGNKSNIDLYVAYQLMCNDLTNGTFEVLKDYYALCVVVLIFMIIKSLELLNIYKNIKLMYLAFNFYLLYCMFFVVGFFLRAFETQFLIVEVSTFIQIFLVDYFLICIYVLEKLSSEKKLLYDTIYFVSKILFFILFTLFLFAIPILLSISIYIKMNLMTIFIMLGIVNTVFIILF